MSAKTTTLGEHIATQKGFAFKSGWFCDSGRPVVKVKDFTANSVDPNEVTHVSEEIAAQYLKYQLRTGDVVIQTVGSWPSAPASVVGKCVRVPRTVDRALLNQNAVKISPSSSLDGGFLYYSLKNPAFGEYIVGTAQGAASQAAITLEAIRAYKINLPDLPTQRKIAGILSSYDDLIENNLRRIKILEQMAQSLYREWFVHFRFPGHESVKFVDSPLGRIPKGWEVTTYREAAIFENGDRGKNYPKAGEFVEQGIPFINAGHLVEGTVDLGSLNYISSAIFKRLRSGKILSGDILFCLRGSPGRTARVASLTQGAIASSLVIIRPTSRSDASWLYYTLSSDGGRRMVDELNNGAAQPNVSVGSIQNYPLLMPPKSILEQFAVFAERVQKLGDNIRAKVSVLRAHRDLLLPKLLSGEPTFK